jgi:adenylylsulfate kinase
MISCFVEIYLNCPLEVCVQRDVKGMYKRALAGELKNFTGVSDPYEEPVQPELVLHTDQETPEQSAEKVLEYLRVRGWEIAP